MARSIYTRTIPSSTRYLNEVRRFVETHAAEAQLPDEAVTQFKIAVDEACTNIIKHAYKGNDAHQIEIAIIIDANRFAVRIRDEGEAFNPNKYKTPNLVEAVKRRRAGGFGVHIMRQVMDRVEYRTRGNVNEVVLTKYLAPPQRNGGTA